MPDDQLDYSAFQSVPVGVLTLALRILTTRLLLIISLVLNASVMVYATWTDSWPRLVGAIAFACFSWCSLNVTLEKKHANHEA